MLVRESDEKRKNRSNDEDDDGGSGGNNNNKEKWDPQWHLFPRDWLLGGERC